MLSILTVTQGRKLAQHTEVHQGTHLSLFFRPLTRSSLAARVNSARVWPRRGCSSVTSLSPCAALACCRSASESVARNHRTTCKVAEVYAEKHYNLIGARSALCLLDQASGMPPGAAHVHTPDLATAAATSRSAARSQTTPQSF